MHAREAFERRRGYECLGCGVTFTASGRPELLEDVCPACGSGDTIPAEE